jgi:DNA polymerase III alpha subunit
MVIPLFKSHYSIGRSILTLDEFEELKPGKDKRIGPDSIFQLAVENGLKHVVLVEDSMHGFLNAFKNAKSAKVQLIFGVRLTVCSDILERKDLTKAKPKEKVERVLREEKRLAKESKIVIFAKNKDGVNDLIRIYSFAHQDGFCNYARIDYSNLKRLWSKNLSLYIPFYDSFLFKNTLTFGKCVPDFSFTEPKYFVEDNGLPFDEILKSRVLSYSGGRNDVVQSKSIYYNKRTDFKAYLTFRCLSKSEGKRKSLAEPEFPHMTSSDFCLEAWKEQNG